MLLGLALLLAGPSFTQVDLINKVKDNKSENAKEGFQWETVVDVERLAVENQGASGTCWSYSTNSFLESEMARMGKEPVDLSEMFIVRTTYEDKADRYVRMHGNLNFGQGGALPDVFDMYKSTAWCRKPCMPASTTGWTTTATAKWRPFSKACSTRWWPTRTKR